MLGTKALAGSSSACKDNPCDPYCKQFEDSPAGIDAGPRLSAGDGGLSIVPEQVEVSGTFSGVRVTPSPGTITVTKIPIGSAPVTDPSPLHLTAELVSASGPPVVTPAAWELSSYSTALVDAAGDFRVFVPVAGPLTATARVGAFAGTTKVTVVVNARDVVDPGGLAGAFSDPPEGTDDNLKVLYPYDGTVFPREVTPPTIQWDPGGETSDLVKLTLRYADPAADIDFTWTSIGPESSPARFAVPSVVWWAFDTTARGKTAQIKLQRLVGGRPRPEHVLNVSFSTDPLRGTIYYWGLNYGVVNKIDAATGFQTPSWLKPAKNPSRCVGCHSVSADGSTIVGQNDLPENGPGATYVASTGAQVFERPGFYGWQAVSPTGKYTIWGDSGTLSESTTAVRLTSLQDALDRTVGALGYTTGPTVLNATFAPDGMHVSFASRSTGWGAWSGYAFGNWSPVSYGQFGDPLTSPFGFGSGWGWGGTPSPDAGYSRNAGGPPGTPLDTAWYFGVDRLFGMGWSSGRGTFRGDYQDYKASTLWVADFSDKPPYFSNLVQVVSTDWYRPVATYPSFTPDGNWIAYQKADEMRTRDHLGELWLTPVDGTAQIELKNANGVVAPGHLVQPGDRSISYEPTISPQSSRDYNWMVFISNRSYGNVLAPCGVQESCGLKQMWVSALDPSPVAGADPSHPAFWLPGQELDDQNMRGYWSKTPCKPSGGSCAESEDCCGFSNDPAKSVASCRINLPATFPLKRTCAAIVPGACATTGGSCSVDSDCCRYTASPQDKCIRGQCKTVNLIKYSPVPFTRDYTSACAMGTHVVWRFFDWKTVTPPDSKIVFTAQTAQSSGALAAAKSVYLGEASGAPITTWTGADVEAALQKAGLRSQLYLRVTAMLTPSTDASKSPTLVEWRQRHDCAPSE